MQRFPPECCAWKSLEIWNVNLPIKPPLTLTLPPEYRGEGTGKLHLILVVEWAAGWYWHL